MKDNLRLSIELMNSYKFRHIININQIYSKWHKKSKKMIY